MSSQPAAAFMYGRKIPHTPRGCIAAVFGDGGLAYVFGMPESVSDPPLI